MKNWIVKNKKQLKNDKEFFKKKIIIVKIKKYILEKKIEEVLQNIPLKFNVWEKN